MRFYFNQDLNTCADENWVISYIQAENPDFESNDIKEELHTKRSYFGWYDCQVSNTIQEKFD